jgi:hypothetical protein
VRSNPDEVGNQEDIRITGNETNCLVVSKFSKMPNRGLLAVELLPILDSLSDVSGLEFELGSGSGKRQQRRRREQKQKKETAHHRPPDGLCFLAL